MAPIVDKVRTAETFGDATTAYPLMIEPWSSLFTDGGSVVIDSIVKPEDPLHAKVSFTVRATWTAEAIQMFAFLQKLGIVWFDIQRRGGGAGQTLCQNKSFGAQTDKMQFIQDILQWWSQLPEWRQEGLTTMHAILKEDNEKGHKNAELIKANPELVLVGKSADTGTGLKGPLRTRGGFAATAKHRPSVVDDAVKVTDLDYAGYSEAIAVPVENAAVYDLRGTEFGGSTAGVRLDPDYPRELVLVEEIGVDGYMVMVPVQMGGLSQSRLVTAGPSGVLHGPGVDSAAYSRELELSLAPKNRIPLSDPRFAEIVTTQPCTMPFTPDQPVRVSFDFGGVENPPVLRQSGTKMFVEIGDPGKTSGADQFFLSNIYIEVISEDKLVTLREYLSGRSTTGKGYIAKDNTILAAARNAGIPETEFMLSSVGDDTHAWMLGKHVAWMLSYFGPIMKMKTEQVVDTAQGKLYCSFILGEEFVFHEDGSITMYTIPRWVKTETTVQAEGKPGLVKHAKIGKIETSAVERTEEEKAAYQQIWHEYQAIMYWHGRIEEARTIITRDFWRAKLLQAKIGGVSPWMLEEDSGEIGMLAQALADDKHRAPAQIEEPPKQAAIPPTAPPADVVSTVKVTEAHYHLPPDGKRVITLKDSGRTREQFDADKKTSNPQYQTAGKDHADWPDGVAIPEQGIHPPLPEKQSDQPKDTEAPKGKPTEEVKPPEDEKCSKCGTVVTAVRPDGVKQPMLQHFHHSDVDILCLQCSGKTEHEWNIAQAATDPKYLKPGSLNASWPKEEEWPLEPHAPEPAQKQVEAPRKEQDQKWDPAIFSRHILVSGCPGVGKSTLVKHLGDRAIDGDWLGAHAMSTDNKPVWLVPRGALALALSHRPPTFMCGNCDNLRRSVTYEDPLSNVHKTKTREPIADLPWRKKVYLWYNPTDEQLDMRFGPDRDNSFGKDPATRERVKACLSTHSKKEEWTASGWTFIDVTQMTIEDVIKRLQAV